MIKVHQTRWQQGKWSQELRPVSLPAATTMLVLVYGDKFLLEDPSLIQDIETTYPDATRVYCSTAGEIFDMEVREETIAVHVLSFEHTRLQAIEADLFTDTNHHQIGKQIMHQLLQPDLKYVMLVADGSLVNGSELIRGINEANELRVPVTGGLAGDGERFDYTLVGLNERPLRGRLLAIGFYGDRLQVGYASKGGWEVFGPERTVTRSASNRLFEIDHQPALDLYKKYLGIHASGLPGSALLFPLAVRNQLNNEMLVRTILSIQPEEGSMLFAGDIPMEAPVRFMKANLDKLVDAVLEAAQESKRHFGNKQAPEVALLISCVGRKMILRNRIEEEIEAVREVLGEATHLMGFYSYGELSPVSSDIHCSLHNQTMTITTLSESSYHGIS